MCRRGDGREEKGGEEGLGERKKRREKSEGMWYSAAMSQRGLRCLFPPTSRGLTGGEGPEEKG